MPVEDDESSEFDERVEDQEGEVSEELTVTLIWNDRSDLDLQVHCPGGRGRWERMSVVVPAVFSISTPTVPRAAILRMMEQPVENHPVSDNRAHW